MINWVLSFLRQGVAMIFTQGKFEYSIVRLFFAQVLMCSGFFAGIMEPKSLIKNANQPSPLLLPNRRDMPH